MQPGTGPHPGQPGHQHQPDQLGDRITPVNHAGKDGEQQRPDDPAEEHHHQPPDRHRQHRLLVDEAGIVKAAGPTAARFLNRGTVFSQHQLGRGLGSFQRGDRHRVDQGRVTATRAQPDQILRAVEDHISADGVRPVQRYRIEEGRYRILIVIRRLVEDEDRRMIVNVEGFLRLEFVQPGRTVVDGQILIGNMQRS